ncbi:MAG TPA: DUF3427 domain-containing protein [Moraxellaceae bacterium]|nr:DUF3427 domain-containing protein [Moraxellaceae bacterium]
MSLPQGLYDLLLSNDLREQLSALDGRYAIDIREVKGSDRRRRLVADLARRLADALEQFNEEDEAGLLEIELINGVLAQLNNQEPPVTSPVEALFSVHEQNTEVSPPRTGLSQPWLFAAGRNDIDLLSELRAELSSADQVDILISFIRWEGVRRLMDLFQSVTATNANGQARTRFRIITSTYIGATEERALTWLAKLPGVEVKVSLDGRRTRLHAKVWVFRRQTGFGSVYVGSANLSAAALTGGLEWTVKSTEVGQRDIFEKAVAHFETLWADAEFQSYDPNNPEHVEALKAALKREGRRKDAPEEVTGIASSTWFEIQPKPFQKIILDKLAHERSEGRCRNLVVAATGTGKTVIAALDYRRLCHELGGRPRLLFVAHRQEILQQALDTYRQVLRDPHFGALLYGGQDPTSKEHLFTTINSVKARDLLGALGTSYWRVVVIDECHHIAADSFAAFATTVCPQFLLGLTATPERGDGVSIACFFDQRPDGAPAAELRLWDALDQQLLAPFEYYAISDPTDFTDIPWGRSAQEKQALNIVVLQDERRARVIAHAVETYVAELGQMRALGFCVSVEHAQMMAERFNSIGIPSLVAHGGMAGDERQAVRRRLQTGEVRAVFSCDLYNEGIDLPWVNTVLLLRPTDSPVVFAQQIGRGLRLWEGKSSCLVLDFIGQYGREYRFERLWRGLAGLSKRELDSYIDKGFTRLPAGCVVHFDQQSRERVLQNLRAILNQTWLRLTRELQGYWQSVNRRDVTLAEFLVENLVELSDLYRKNGRTGWLALCADAGMRELGAEEGFRELAPRLQALLHHNDPKYLHFLSQELVTCDPAQEATARRLRMLGYQLRTSGAVNAKNFHHFLLTNPLLLEELAALATVLGDASDIGATTIEGAPTDWPLALAGRYSRAEILASVGRHTDDKRASSREGVLRLTEQKIELMFVTLDKSKGFHADISYRDYAVCPSVFHWQTQNSTKPESDVGRQYRESPVNGWRFFLFVREGTDDAYHALGQVVQGGVTGSAPMSITWNLVQPMEMALFQRLSVLRS